MKKAGIIVLCALVVIGTGTLAWRVLSSKETDQTSAAPASANSSAALQDTAAMKQTEEKFKTYTGEDYDRYYMAMMISHHQSAVDMAKLALTNAQRQELKTLANDIISSQSAEIKKMTGWQQAWGYPVSFGPNMVDMSAMAMEEEMAPRMESLKKLSGDAFDKQFVSMMIEHHESAIAMSRPAASNAKRQEIKDLASAVISAQTAEVLKLQGWQKSWGFVADASSNGSSMGGDMSGMDM